MDDAGSDDGGDNGNTDSDKDNADNDDNDAGSTHQSDTFQIVCRPFKIPSLVIE
jgi:hypothetical protein